MWDMKVIKHLKKFIPIINEVWERYIGIITVKQKNLAHTYFSTNASANSFAELNFGACTFYF